MSSTPPPPKKMTKKEWIATDKDPALETAIVYESETSKKCGHALHLVPLMDYLEASGSKKASCPVCSAPLEFICDGMVKQLETVAAASGGTSKKIQGAATIKANNNNNNKIVTFKHRNHLYRLAVMRAESQTNALPYSLCLWMWNMVLHVMGENTTVTAQERISHVLRMDINEGMKILHKGKILFPNTQQSPQAVSTQILDVCEKGGKPLVMGRRLTEREKQIATAKWVSTFFYNIVKVCLAKTLSILQNILTPVLALGGIRGPAGDNHPHRD